MYQPCGSGPDTLCSFMEHVIFQLRETPRDRCAHPSGRVGRGSAGLVNRFSRPFSTQRLGGCGPDRLGDLVGSASRKAYAMATEVCGDALGGREAWADSDGETARSPDAAVPAFGSRKLGPRVQWT